MRSMAKWEDVEKRTLINISSTVLHVDTTNSISSDFTLIERTHTDGDLKRSEKKEETE